MAPISRKIFTLKSIKTQKATNAPHLISQSEPLSSEEIMVPKMQTDLSVYFLEKEAILPPETCIPRKKPKVKSLATSPPRKYPITNQDKTP